MRNLDKRLKELVNSKSQIFDQKKLRWTIISGIPNIDAKDENELEIGL